MMTSHAAGAPFLDLVFGEELQQLLDHCESVFKVRAGYFSLDGHLLLMGRSKHSRYCEIIRTEVYGSELCHASDMRNQALCLESLQPLCYRCHAGLEESVYPVIINGRPAGFMMIGQLRTAKRIPAKVLADCADAEIRGRLSQAFKSLPLVSGDKMASIQSLFVMLLQFAVVNEMVAIRGDWLWEKLSRHIDAKLLTKITLADLSRVCGRSISTVSQALKAKSGKTFKQIVTERRLEYAERLMTDRPDLGIGEIARMAGFEDSLYFSRVYHRTRGQSPSEKRSLKHAVPAGALASKPIQMQIPVHVEDRCGCADLVFGAPGSRPPIPRQGR